jgi:hypothetical protein
MVHLKIIRFRSTLISRLQASSYFNNYNLFNWLIKCFNNCLGGSEQFAFIGREIRGKLIDKAGVVTD